jgi:Predicted 3'-5' exonuclease related to the exonuclease domain of PolB
MRRIFLDIETLPPELCEHGCEAPCMDEEFRKLALKAERGRLLCIGLIVEEGGQILHRGILGRDRRTMSFHMDERRTLHGLWRLFESFDIRRDLVIGFNCFDFDLAFLYKRSTICRVRPAVVLSFARYRSAPIFDVMKEWERWSWNRISLHDLALSLNLKSSKDDGICGANVYDNFCAGRHEEIADYCMRDVELTKRIYSLMQFEECVA